MNKPKSIKCFHCYGTGRIVDPKIKKVVPCPACNGTGKRKVGMVV